MKIDYEKYEAYFTKEEVDAIVVEAQNDDKDPIRVLGGRLTQAKKAGQKAFQENQSKANLAPPEEDDGMTFQTRDDFEGQTNSRKQLDVEAPVDVITEEGESATEKVEKLEQSRAQVSRSGMGRSTREGTSAAGRSNRGKDRIPFHQRNVMTTEKRNGFQRRWFNDTDARIQAALDAGWDFVYKEDYERVGDSTGASEGADLGSRVSKPAGGGVTAFLMEIPQELYNEDQAAKQEKVLASEQDMLPDASKEHRDSWYSNNPGGKPIVRS